MSPPAVLADHVILKHHPNAAGNSEASERSPDPGQRGSALGDQSIAVDFTPVEDVEDRPEIIECEIRLHSGRPTNEGTGQLSWADWSATVVGHAVTFQAIADMGKGAWNGPLAPGVQIAPPVALSDPYWTVFLPGSTGVPIMVGQVGHPLAIGEAFNLPPGEPGGWKEGVVFDGAIVIE